MNDATQARKLIILGIVVPMAAFIGYRLATPDSFSSIGLVGLVLGVLFIPVFMRWHYPLMILSWNASISVFFLPGEPALWMLMVLISLFFGLLNRAMSREKSFLHVPSVAWPLILFAIVILLTAKLTGGIGIRSLGGETFGGKGYINLLVAIMGYFALTSKFVPSDRARLYVSVFLLSGLSTLISNLAYVAGPSFWWLFNLFPLDVAIHQVLADFMIEQTVISRLSGVTFAATAAFAFMMMRFGIRGVFDLQKPWRSLAFVVILACSFLGGFRSAIAMIAITFLIQFYLEGLFRSRLFAVLVLAGGVIAALLVPLANKLPLTVQRSISFLPLDLDPVAKSDADGSIEWRLEMWRIMWPQIPKYLFLGKGYAINPTDLYLATESVRRGLAKDYEPALIAGSYHNGPLSLIIPFGIFGVIMVVWFLIASLRVLYWNYLWGPPEHKNINTFFLAYFIMRIILFLFLFGAIGSDLLSFIGIIGLSISINGGVRKPADSTPRPVPLPATGLAHSV